MKFFYVQAQVSNSCNSRFNYKAFVVAATIGHATACMPHLVALPICLILPIVQSRDRYRTRSMIL